MEFNHDPRQSIIREVEPDNESPPPPPRILSINPRSTDRWASRSIVRRNAADDQEEHSLPPPPPLHNGDRPHEPNPTLLGATGYNPPQSDELDEDEAFALRLQQEEYSKQSLIPQSFRYHPFGEDPYEEVAVAATPAARMESDPSEFTTDEDFAKYLQAQEERQRAPYRRPPISFFPIPSRSNPASSQSSQTDEASNERIHPFFRQSSHQPTIHDEDSDDDEDNYSRMIPHPFFQFLARQSRSTPEGVMPFFPGIFAHAHRRTGNLQDTEEDFGPEDYERLLQLDDNIDKKKLTPQQINTIPIIPFARSADKSDEGNKCGICLERFEEKQSIRRFPCHHIYHKECADRWLQESNACPICRVPPVSVQPTPSSRSSRPAPHRRTSNPTRHHTSSRYNGSTTTNNNNNNNAHQNHRRGQGPQRQS